MSPQPVPRGATRRAAVRAGLAALLVAAAGRALAHPPAAGAGAGAAGAGEPERQVEALREAVRAAVAARDAAALRALYAESFTHTHGSGKVDGRDARVVALLAGDPTIEMAPASELSHRAHGPDLVVLTGRSPIRNVAEGRDYDFRWVQVFARSGGVWRIVVSQATRLPPAT